MRFDWRKYWWQPGFTCSFLVVGVPYWLIPYNRVNLPDALLGPGLVIVVMAAALARAFSGRPFMRVVAVMGGVVPAVVMARVVFDGMRDASSHNLWPLEMIIAALVGGTVAVAGALLGSIAVRLSSGKSGDEQKD